MILGLPQWLVLAVALQRVAELAYARRNTRRLLAEGAVEHGRRHYGLLVLLHAAWLAAIALATPPTARPDWLLLALFLALQAARLWVVATLGRRWTTRIIVPPARPLVRRGPYRLMRHPNYAVVAGEIAVLPLVFGQWTIAVAFSLLNALVTGWRIRVEDRALGRGRGLPVAIDGG